MITLKIIKQLMGDETICLSCFFILLNLALSLTLIILNFVWIFPVMNNSKEEPLVEIGSILAPDNSNLDLDSLRSSRGDCDKNFMTFMKMVSMKLLILK